MVDYGITRGGTISGALTISGSAPTGGLLHVINTASAPSDHTVIVEGVNATDRAFGMLVTGDTQDRHNMTIAGLHQWGNGAGGLDTNLYRSAANSLATDDALASLAASTNAVNAGTAGGGVAVKEGANARQGVSTMVAGTVTVANTSVTATTRIQLTVQSLGTVAAPKAVAVTARIAGTSFTITSADATDTSVVAWNLYEPA